MSLSPSQVGKPLKIQKRIQETADSVSLVLEIPAEHKTLFRYQAGQFVSFFLTLNGETISRSYSLSTSPLTDQEFKVTIKKVPGGRGSTYLCDQAKEGDTLLTTPPAGHFFKPQSPEGAHYLLFAAGSGITPVYSIMKTVLEASAKNKVTLVYCNRSEDGIIYRQELDNWISKHGGRLQVVHTLTKPSPAWKGKTGRLGESLTREVVAAANNDKLPLDCYLCGPTDFMNAIKATLEATGVNKTNIHIEDFGLSVHKVPAGPKVEENWTFIGPDKVTEQPEKIVVQLNGETIEVAAKAGQNIIETLLQAGAQPPYSCLDGACMACMGKIQEGRVYQEDPGILTDDNVANCEALTCQAKPLSRIVKVSYDNL
jgi:ring-1,2-phenylacetyl-CoA epoxidase subunit PaaE